MSSWQFELTCPYDGEPTVHVTTGTTDGWSTRAVAQCTACHTELVIVVVVTAPNGDRRVTPARRAALARTRAARRTPQAVG